MVPYFDVLICTVYSVFSMRSMINHIFGISFRCINSYQNIEIKKKFKNTVSPI